MHSRVALITVGAAEALGRHGLRIVVTRRGSPEQADGTVRLLRKRGEASGGAFL